MLTLKINGTEKSFDGETTPATLTDLLSLMNIDQATVVAEIDTQIIERANFATTKLITNQTIELIRFVGGG
jgi:sulfur carrier protein